MNNISNDSWDIINDYKYQLEHKDKFNECLRNIEGIYRCKLCYGDLHINICRLQVLLGMDVYCSVYCWDIAKLKKIKKN